MPYLTFTMSSDRKEDPGYLRFRIGGLTTWQIQDSGLLQPLFDRAKVTEFMGSNTVWLRFENLNSDKAPCLIGLNQEPATEAVVPFFNQFEEWGYIMVGSSPHFTTGAASGISEDFWSSTWIFHKGNFDKSLENSGSFSPVNVKKSLKIPNPDY